MFVPPPFPPPEEVRNSVADANWRDRLSFVQRALLGIGVATGLFHVAGLLSPWFKNAFELKVVAGCLLLAMSLVRVVVQNRRIETNISFGLAALLVPVLGIIFNAWTGFHHMAASTILPWVGFAYSLLSSRNFSFFALFFLMLLGGVITAFMVARAYGDTWLTPALVSGACSLYLAYDLSMVVRRRAVGEHWAAVADVLRDPLNVVSYCQKVVQHWRKYRILPTRFEF